MSVLVASICPIERALYKHRFAPRKLWYTPAVKRGSPPAVITFEDGITEPNQYVAYGEYRDNSIEAVHVALDFINSNMNMLFSNPPAVQPGIWLVGTLGENITFTILGASNSGATILQLDRPHGITAPIDVQIAGATNFWAVINGKLRASPMNETSLVIDVDSRNFGEFSNGGANSQLSITQHLTLDQEAEIMRPRQDRWLQRILNQARATWAKEKSTTHIIPLHHIAAEWFGVEGEEWQVALSTDGTKTVDCQYCHKRVDRAPICANCHNVLDFAAYARLEEEKAAAIRAEKRRIKEATEAEEKKIRDANLAANRAAREASREELVEVQEG